jgi:hypothetical protein
LAYLQAELILLSAIVTLLIVYVILRQFELWNGKRYPIAGVKPSDYKSSKNDADLPSINFKAAPNSFMFQSMRPGLLMPLFGLFFGGFPLAMLLFTLTINLQNNMGWAPGFEVAGPVLMTGFLMLFVLAGLTQVISMIQQFRGVSNYIITSKALLIRNMLGDTMVPFKLIESVDMDKIMVNEYYEPKGGKRGGHTLKATWTTGNGQSLSYRRDSLLPQFMGAPFFSCDSGECAVIKLKDSEIRLALTPEDVKGFVEELGSRVT